MRRNGRIGHWLCRIAAGGVLAAAALAVPSVHALAGGAAAPPKDFRSWTHTKSTVVADKNNPLHGFHNQYVNTVALPTLRAGGTYKDGAVFVDKVNEVAESSGIYTPGKRAKILVMTKSRKAAATGGWIFQAFGPDGKPLAVDPVKGCFECHDAKAKESDRVFHKYAE